MACSAAARAVTARVVFAVRARLRGLAADQLIEVALFPARGLLLVEEREVGLVEFLEELVPGYLLEIVVVGIGGVGEFKAENLGPAYDRRAAAARLGPFADLVVVGGDRCLGHGSESPVYPLQDQRAAARRVQPRRLARELRRRARE